MSTKKLTPELVAKAAGQVGISKEQQQALFEMLADMSETDTGETEKPPTVKKQWLFMLSDPTGRFTNEFLEASGIGALTGWVVQIPEEHAPHVLRGHVCEAAHHFNSTKKGRLVPVQTVGEACENIPAKIFKEYGIWLKTKLPVYAIPVSSEIAGTPSVLGDDRGELKQ